LANRILDLSTGVGRRLTALAAAASAGTSAAAAVAEGKEEKKSTDWISLMKNERFGEVREFKFHHFSKEPKVAGSRVYSRRLQSEFADLYKCLPLHPDSSIFCRVQDGNMSHVQILVTAPVDTPYARGAFLFDVYFPSEYPVCSYLLSSLPSRGLLDSCLTSASCRTCHPKLTYKQQVVTPSDLILIYIKTVMYVYHYWEPGKEVLMRNGSLVYQHSYKYVYPFKV
jgi:hypothetical protein